MNRWTISVNTFQHSDTRVTYSVRVWKTTAGQNARRPHFTLSGELRVGRSESPTTAIREVLEQLLSA